MADWPGRWEQCTAALPSPGAPAHCRSKKPGLGEPEGCPVEDSTMWPRSGCLLWVPSVTRWDLFQALLLTKVGWSHAVAQKASPVLVSRDLSPSVPFLHCSLTHPLLSQYTLTVL